MLEAGKPFPNFSLPNQDGKTVSLGDFAGRWLVVYFYPKDDTPGCTIQGQSFTATKSDFDAAGISVVGVSQDDVGSKKAVAISSASKSTFSPKPKPNCSTLAASASPNTKAQVTGIGPASSSART